VNVQKVVVLLNVRHTLRQLAADRPLPPQ